MTRHTIQQSLGQHVGPNLVSTDRQLLPSLLRSVCVSDGWSVIPGRCTHTLTTPQYLDLMPHTINLSLPLVASAYFLITPPPPAVSSIVMLCVSFTLMLLCSIQLHYHHHISNDYHASKCPNLIYTRYINLFSHCRNYSPYNTGPRLSI